MKKLVFTLMLLVWIIPAAVGASPSGTLPVIHININNGEEVTSKENYLKAQYWFEPNGTEGVEAIGSAASPLTLQIKGRGNYTFTGFDKKPYRLKLDKKQPLGGMESSKHFGLLAHADDFRGFLRNTMGFEISKNLGLPWTPEQRPVEVVINGTYRGLYFLVELIRIDKKRVNITEWQEEDADGNKLSKWIEGGSLVEIDNYPEDGQIELIDGDGYEMRVTYDKSVDPGYEPDGYREWLTNQFRTMNSLIFGDKNSDEIWNYIDIDDCARFMLTQEILNNYESFHGSCYLHREKGDGEKWHFSPAWDFGSAMFMDNFPDCHFWQIEAHHNHWAAQLWQFPALQKKMAQYWSAYKQANFRNLPAFAETFLNTIKEGARCDKDRWPQYGNDNLNEKLAYFKNFIKGSESWLNRTLQSNPDDPNDNPNPDEFTVPEDEENVYHVFFKPTGDNVNWQQVLIFYWHDGLHYRPSSWPGHPCELVKVKDRNYWHYKLTSDYENEDFMLIFGNGGTDKGTTQTYDLKVRKRGVYTIDMPDHAEPGEFLAVGAGPSDVDAIEGSDAEAMSIFMEKEGLRILSPEPRAITIVSIDGTARQIILSAGENSISLSKGVYIIEGKKFML